jgi:hypothetical protein
VHIAHARTPIAVVLGVLGRHCHDHSRRDAPALEGHHARRRSNSGALKLGIGNWVKGMISGSQNVVSIGITTGAAGIIIDSISLTGAHQVVGELVEFLSGGDLNGDLSRHDELDPRYGLADHGELHRALIAHRSSLIAHRSWHR